MLMHRKTLMLPLLLSMLLSLRLLKGLTLRAQKRQMKRLMNSRLMFLIILLMLFPPFPFLLRKLSVDILCKWKPTPGDQLSGCRKDRYLSYRESYGDEAQATT